jgi:2-polyprenyl-6-methoxyphenol hydroxylase-like FAD-dependent oxidoreductase
VILGAGFAGLELATRLSESHGEVGVTLIDQNDSFSFGFSKLDILFGQRALLAGLGEEYRRYARRAAACSPASGSPFDRRRDSGRALDVIPFAVRGLGGCRR